ncbi:caspase domain-containing protein [Microbulbifer sp. JSM ZJ756]|uniref:caspase domain-containing protein n=1 Tax=Microbulbifer sp. JSM ZJ756 TaxID=3376191 RepID=UPI00378B6210
MRRAAVLIGVKKVPPLPELQAVWDCVERMAEWMQSQGVSKEDIRIITDEDEPTNIGRIKRAVRELVFSNTVEQLIVYFSGHGINNARNEYWLLSDATTDPDDAVNVTYSEEFARHCGIPHIVFVSDACRTAAEGIRAQGIRGGTIFPSLDVTGLEKHVDLFFATILGHPSLEIKDVTDSAGRYQAVYTDTLLEALRGAHVSIAEMDQQLGRKVIRPRPLKDFLTDEVPKRVFARTKKSQQPDARITSLSSAWISTLPSGAASEDRAPTPMRIRPGRWHRGFIRLPLFKASRSSASAPARTTANSSELESLSARAFLNATKVKHSKLRPLLGRASDLDPPEVRMFKEIVKTSARTFGPRQFETQCGFKVSGAKVKDTFAVNASTKILSENSHLVHIGLQSGTPENILLIFENGTGVVLPAIQDFIGALTFLNGELVSVNYDPVDTSWRWKNFETQQQILQNLRAVVAASSAMGSFRINNDEEAERIARAMQVEKSLDPSLSVYAAYAYRDQGNRSRIQEMASYQQGDLGICLFDVAMLSQMLDDPAQGNTDQVLPFAPLLSQGWSLLPAHGINLPPSLEHLRAHVNSNSLWTLYDADGVARIRTAMQNKEV